MRDYEDDIRDMEEDTERDYSNYMNDAEYMDFEDMEEGDYDDEVEYIPMYPDEYYDNYTRTNIGRINPNDRTYTFVIQNISGSDQEAILFGANEEAPQPAGVTVIVEESSHKEVREESKANPFKIVGMKMSVSDPLQFDNVLRLVTRSSAGSNTSHVFQPRNATSPQNFSQSLIDASSFEMDVTGQDSLRFIIKDGVTVVFTFSVKARANMGNVLKGNNVAELSRSPRMTGLPQIDLLRERKPKVFGLRPRRLKRPPMRRRRRKFLRRR